MYRRNFSRLLGFSIFSLPFSGTNINFKPEKLNPILPKPLNKDDTVGLIAPASNASEEKVNKALQNLRALGLKVVEGKALRKRNGFFAGTDEERVADIHQMYRRDDIDAIWCVRGGYGTTRLLRKLDYNLIGNNPKALIGYSDITALHLAIFKKTGIMGFHGPVASSEMTDYASANIRKVLFRDQSSLQIKTAEERPEKGQMPYVFQSGRARGRLLGGNLSLITAMCGTGFLPDFSDAVVFLEDIGEKTYRIDRMLVQLFQAANIDKASGIILGQFTDCEAENGDQTIMETLKMHFNEMKIPVMGGFSIGHIDNQAMIPVGAHAHINTDDQLIDLYLG